MTKENTPPQTNTKAVPHEPTPEMIAAAMRADQDGMSASMKTIWMVMWGAYQPPQTNMRRETAASISNFEAAAAASDTSISTFKAAAISLPIANLGDRPTLTAPASDDFRNPARFAKNCHKAAPQDHTTALPSTISQPTKGAASWPHLHIDRLAAVLAEGDDVVGLSMSPHAERTGRHAGDCDAGDIRLFAHDTLHRFERHMALEDITVGDRGVATLHVGRHALARFDNVHVLDDLDAKCDAGGLQRVGPDFAAGAVGILVDHHCGFGGRQRRGCQQCKRERAGFQRMCIHDNLHRVRANFQIRRQTAESFVDRRFRWPHRRRVGERGRECRLWRCRKSYGTRDHRHGLIGGHDERAALALAGGDGTAGIRALPGAAMRRLRQVMCHRGLTRMRQVGCRADATSGSAARQHERGHQHQRNPQELDHGKYDRIAGGFAEGCRTGTNARTMAGSTPHSTQSISDSLPRRRQARHSHHGGPSVSGHTNVICAASASPSICHETSKRPAASDKALCLKADGRQATNGSPPSYAIFEGVTDDDRHTAKDQSLRVPNAEVPLQMASDGRSAIGVSRPSGATHEQIDCDGLDINETIFQKHLSAGANIPSDSYREHPARDGRSMECYTLGSNLVQSVCQSESDVFSQQNHRDALDEVSQAGRVFNDAPSALGLLDSAVAHPLGISRHKAPQFEQIERRPAPVRPGTSLPPNAIHGSTEMEFSIPTSSHFAENTSDAEDCQ